MQKPLDLFYPSVKSKTIQDYIYSSTSKPTYQSSTRLLSPYSSTTKPTYQSSTRLLSSYSSTTKPTYRSSTRLLSSYSSTTEDYCPHTVALQKPTNYRSTLQKPLTIQNTEPRRTMSGNYLSKQSF